MVDTKVLDGLCRDVWKCIGSLEEVKRAYPEGSKVYGDVDRVEDAIKALLVSLREDLISDPSNLSGAEIK